VPYPWPVGRSGCGTKARPSFGGAEWLASLYWVKIIPDPYVFLCPAARDGNGDGIELSSDGCPGGRPLSDDAVSYAGMADVSVGIYLAERQGRGASYAASKLAIRGDFPPNEPMACDDTEEPINHGSARTMNVLFFDSHVEYWEDNRIDPERGVGMKGGELAHLRN